MVAEWKGRTYQSFQLEDATDTQHYMPTPIGQWRHAENGSGLLGLSIHVVLLFIHRVTASDSDHDYDDVDV